MVCWYALVFVAVATPGMWKRRRGGEDEDFDFDEVPLVELRHLVFRLVPAESYRRRLGSLLRLCDVFRALIISLVCVFGKKICTVSQLSIIIIDCGVCRVGFLLLLSYL